MKKKILFVASEFASGMIPFAATAINALAKDDRFEVHCLCVNSGIYSYRNIILQEANPVFLEYPKSKMMKLFYKLWPLEIIKHLSQLEKSINPDAVHFLTGDFTLALYICLNNKRTFYYTVHDLHPHEVVRKTLLGYLMQKYIIWGYKLCRNIIPNLTTSSYFQLKELNEIYPYKKVKYTSFPSLITSLIINGKKMPLEVSGLKEYILFFGTVYSYFYPSVNGSWLISSTYRDQLPEWISFAKIRGSWAQVGNDTSPYIINPAYQINTSTLNGTNYYGMSLPGTMYDQDLKPERKNAWEIGLDWRFLNNRIGLDATYYKENTKDQIMEI